MDLVVTSITPYYTTTINANEVIPKREQMVVKGYLPGNGAYGYVVVDPNCIITRVGQQRVSLRPFTSEELDTILKQPTTDEWYSPVDSLYYPQHLIDLDKYFLLEEWKDELEHWLTEGLKKDPRLINCIKSQIIPLTLESTQTQPLNAHIMANLNTGAGKSHWAYLWGEEPKVGATEAGALGSYDIHAKGDKQIPGFLQGSGFPVIVDEANTMDKPLIQKLLTYLETGKVTRALKYSVYVNGTKTIILTGNPSCSDVESSFIDFLRQVGTLVEPSRMGRRFGFLLLGNDYLRVQGEGDVSRRSDVEAVIRTATHVYRSQIEKLIQSEMEWIQAPEKEIVDEIQSYAKSIPTGVARDFVMGQSYSCVRKLKAASIRYLILEQLDRISSKSVTFHDKEKTFEILMDVNRDSWGKLAKVKPSSLTKREYVEQLHAENPNYSNRELAEIAGVSHTSVNGWLTNVAPEAQ